MFELNYCLNGKSSIVINKGFTEILPNEDFTILVQKRCKIGLFLHFNTIFCEIFAQALTD